jgi:hypothetical protein
MLQVTFLLTYNRNLQVLLALQQVMLLLQLLYSTARDFQLTGDVETSAVSFDGTGNVNLTTVIGTGVIVNADINASAAIDKTKISGTAITAADSGTVTSAMIEDGTIVNADVSAICCYCL